ncbi:MAG: response regulator [Candidatus Omnitrophica bacterium]|nr:response regulator [Candidatus Omnitrophota bacterium]
MEKRKIVFFLDDDGEFLELLPHMIHHPDYEVRTYHVTNGYHIVDEIVRVKPNVIFMDFFLPRVNGAQVLPILRFIRELSGTPIYLMTGYPMEHLAPFLREVSYSGIILKQASFKEEVLKILDGLEHAHSCRV